MENKLPTFLIVGAAKSGTTSLYHYLREHPDVFMPFPKEPRFFAFADTTPPDNDWERQSLTRLEDYLSLFREAGDSGQRGEASVHYLLLYETTIRNIKKYHPDWRNLKIAIILRSPVERAFSNYSMLRMKGAEPLGFDEALQAGEGRRQRGEGVLLDYVGAGMYHDQVKAYVDTFPRLKVFLYDDLQTEPAKLVRDFYAFLGVDDSYSPESIRRIYNPSGVPRSRTVLTALDRFEHFFVTRNWQRLAKPFVKPFVTDRQRRQELFDGTFEFLQRMRERNLKKDRMSPSSRRRLLEVYREDISRLQGLIGRDLSHWLR
jgi:hypothetical protein